MQHAIRLSYLFIFLALTVFIYKRFWVTEAIAEQVKTEHLTIAPPTPPPPPEPTETWVVYQVKKGDTVGKILTQYGISTRIVLEKSKDLHDISNIRPGQKIHFLKHEHYDVPIEIKFPINEDEHLLFVRTVAHDKTESSSENGEHKESKTQNWSVNKETIEYTTQFGYRKFTVTSSLWKAAVDAGLRPSDIASLAKVLEYDIDFNTEIRAGATAEMLVEELYLDGSFVKLGSPSILHFTNKDTLYSAYYYINKDKEGDYYDKKGVSRKGAFLRSPLPFSRVTSGFNPKRFHPISKKVRPHNGTDFGAPTGTPVRAVADGTVTFAGTNGGHGKFVKITHQSPYKTSYSHLSKILVRKGQRVKQGDLIGKVGTTGASTGPHLHYQVWKNNKYVDAMKEKMPRNKVLPSSEKKRFQKEIKTNQELMDKLKAEN
ncbi:MAG: hypothetical protein CMK59_15125 [Proteobacteria bacterium]|nr:hypothetical protein [Pseudomonadota bacterium]